MEVTTLAYVTTLKQGLRPKRVWHPVKKHLIGRSAMPFRLSEVGRDR